MHNGAFVKLEDAIRHHLDPYTSARTYTTSSLPPDLQGPLGPIEPVLARLDSLLQTPILLTDAEFADLVDFVQNGLLDPRILPQHLRNLIPNRVPSGSQTLTFEFDSSRFELSREIGIGGEANTIARAPVLLQNYPNPFNPSTAIGYQLSADGWVVLKVYNTLGQEVATLVDEVQTAGYKTATWNGRNDFGSPVASGLYIYTLKAGNVVKSERMLLMK